LWDNDTLRDERRGLPGIAEILSGRFERHSQLFYRDRAAKMKARLAADSSDLAAYDNLAVAHEKLGDQDAAIAVMLAKDKVKPGEYTTHANLGTFYLHKGDFENGVAHIRKALDINPDAHFGRERYQLQAAEYLQRAMTDPTVFDGGSFVTPIVLPHPTTQPGEDQLTADQRAEAYRARMEVVWTGRSKHHDKAVDDAIEGVVGMIRFGTGTSPHLYHALGDLLAARGDKHLAYRAYHRALEYAHPRPELLKTAMEQVKEMVEHPTEMTDEVIAKERAGAERWVAAYQSYEDDLVRRGVYVEGDEAQYAAFYKANGAATADLRSRWLPFRRELLFVIAAIVLGFLWLVWRVIISHKRARVEQPA
jgi:tetratricopeptide (TPR) repeat protein